MHVLHALDMPRPLVKVSFWSVLDDAAGMFQCMRLHILALRGWG